MDHKAFKAWCDQYTDDSNFSDEKSHMVAKMLLCSLWMDKDKELAAKDEKIKKLTQLLKDSRDVLGRAKHDKMILESGAKEIERFYNLNIKKDATIAECLRLTGILKKQFAMALEYVEYCPCGCIEERELRPGVRSKYTCGRCATLSAIAAFEERGDFNVP